MSLLKNGKFWLPLVLWLVACGCYYQFFFASAQVDIQIETDTKSWFRIYWATEDQQFSAKRTAKARIYPGRKNYSFSFTNLARVDRLRIDPHEFAGETSIRSIRIQQTGFQDIVFSTAADFAKLQQPVQIVSTTHENGKFTVVSDGGDPSFVFWPEKTRQDVNWGIEILRLLAFGGCVVFLYWGVAGLVIDYRFVPVCLVAILSIVLTMALISRDNSHPDEYVHVAAVEYYQDNWLPPAVDDEDVRHSYSPYGTSRLNTDEIYYLINGKFSKIVKPFYTNRYVVSRMFNVALLLIILVYVTRVAEARIVALPLLISPQIWYLYSYCNSDAFALTIAFFAACQVVLPGSALHRFLSQDFNLKWFISAVILGLGLGMLVLVKANYIVFLCFLILVTAIYWYRLHDSHQRKIWLQRLALLCVVAAVLIGGKKMADYHVSGPERDAKIMETRIELADPLFNPANPIEKQHSYLGMKERGIPLLHLIEGFRWFEKTFRSSFGVYGYFTMSATYEYYDLMRWSALSLMLFFFGSIFLKGGIYNSFAATAMLAASAALIGASLNHSWTQDFQTQGRYLFPIVGMLCVLCGLNRHILNQRWLSLLTVWMFGLSSYSFIVIALQNVPRLASY